MKTVFGWFRYLLTDKNNEWDLSILLWLSAVIIFLYKATQANPFDFLNFGVGCVGVFGAGKALEWLSERHAKLTPAAAAAPTKGP
jgi:hypothetical protein